jgi:predicted metal-dependent hydrolase
VEQGHNVLMRVIDLFIEMLQNHEFAEAHEVLEDDWKAYRAEGKKDESNILKGFINAATSFELQRLGRKSALIPWQTYLKYRALIDTVDSLHVKKYRECAAYIDEKYEEIFGK